MPATGSKSYHPLSLSIRLRADGFSFFVCDPQTNSLIRGEHFRLADDEALATRLQHELGRPDYFNRQIEQAFVLVGTPSTHVPIEEFHRGEAAEFYHFTFAGHDPSTERVAYTILPELESVEIYAIPHDVEEVILQYYPTARLFASRAMLTERIFHVYEDNADDAKQLFVCLYDGHIDVIAFAESHLRFANTFEATAPANIQYFVLNIWQMLRLDAEADRLVLITETASADSGTSVDSSTLSSLQQGFSLYLRNIDTLTPDDLFSHVPLAREKQMPLDMKALLLNRI